MLMDLKCNLIAFFVENRASKKKIKKKIWESAFDKSLDTKVDS